MLPTEPAKSIDWRSSDSASRANDELARRRSGARAAADCSVLVMSLKVPALAPDAGFARHDATREAAGRWPSPLRTALPEGAAPQVVEVVPNDQRDDKAEEAHQDRAEEERIAYPARAGADEARCRPLAADRLVLDRRVMKPDEGTGAVAGLPRRAGCSRL
jgi:hypothetical protein